MKNERDQEKSTEVAVHCYHCGEECQRETVVFDNKTFCCEGCKTIYDLLKENNLCTYYSMQSAPGIKDKDPGSLQYQYLDEDTVRSKMLLFSHENTDHVKFYIPNIHCSSCIWLLENLDKINPGVLSTRVDFLKKEATVAFDRHQLKLSEVASLLSHIGYPPLISLNAVETKKEKQDKRERIIKIGIAGFCFGNIMMMSFPEYFASGNFHENQNLKYLFTFLNLGLALPVLFYCGTEFFVSGWKGLRNGHLNIDAPIALAIAVTFTRSLYEILSFTGPGYLDSMSGIVFFMLVGRFFQDRTYEALSFDRDYKSYFPLGVIVMRDGVEKNIPAFELQTGDRIMVRNNELVPADAVLLDKDTHVDYSFITGESAPVKKRTGELIYAGARQIDGAAEMLVSKPVSQSYLTQLWNNDEESKNRQSRKKSFTDSVNKYFTLFVMAIAMASALAWWFIDSSKSLDAFTAVLIVACPCGLLLTTTFTNGNVLRIFGRNKFYLKNSAVIEKLATADTIVFDKTGTITNGASVNFTGNALNEEERTMVAALAAQSSHPLSMKLFQSLSGEGALPNVMRFMEFPGRGITGLVANKKISLGNELFLTGRLTHQTRLTTRVYLAIDDEVRGYFSFTAHYRPGLQELALHLSKTHRIKMLSGDNDAEKERLGEIFGPGADLRFNQAPEDKKNCIRHDQESGHKLLMVGDGLNDAGALIQSDAGIAVSDNTNTFSPACDAILDGSSLHLLPKFIEMAGANRKIITATFIFSLIYNIAGLFFAVQGSLSPVIAAILMPASTITIVLLTTLSTNIAARRRRL